MKFFIPEWDDKVDPEYDFIRDTHSSSHNNEKIGFDHYMWDIFGENNVPFDGLLVSIATINKNKRKFEEIQKIGVHEYFGLSKNIDIMGDCGAFSYIDEQYPTYTTKEAFDFYEKCGFNYGVTVDHLVVPAFKDEIAARMDITRKNGLEGLKLWKNKYSDKFQLIVAIQGETIEDYLSMYHDFMSAGATNVAFGSLVRARTDFIQQLIKAIITDIKSNDIKPKSVHFFGVARLGLFKFFKELEDTGVHVSFDSASYLRKAWLSSPSSQSNYLSGDITDSYSAIRIPKTHIPKEGLTPKIALQLQLENLALQKLRDYDKGKETLDSVLQVLLEFNKSHNFDSRIIDFYERTLKDKPWKKCKCSVCKELGIEVMIFRGNNRNRRRGFHNVYTFYNVLKSGQTDFPESSEKRYQKLRLRSPANNITDLSGFNKDENVLVIVGCSKKKESAKEPIPAKNLYLGNVFKLSLSYADLMGYPIMIISAKYGLIKATDDILEYDKVLKTFADSETIRPLVEPRVKKLLPKYDKILVVAGEKYRRTLINIEDERFYYLKTGGIGLLQKILKDTIINICQTQLSDYKE